MIVGRRGEKSRKTASGRMIWAQRTELDTRARYVRAVGSSISDGVDGLGNGIELFTLYLTDCNTRCRRNRRYREEVEAVPPRYQQPILHSRYRDPTLTRYINLEHHGLTEGDYDICSKVSNCRYPRISVEIGMQAARQLTPTGSFV